MHRVGTFLPLLSISKDINECNTTRQRWEKWQMQYRQEAHRKQFRFRKDPAAYLAALEAQLLE
jgi:hypothetical protein